MIHRTPSAPSAVFATPFQGRTPSSNSAAAPPDSTPQVVGGPPPVFGYPQQVLRVELLHDARFSAHANHSDNNKHVQVGSDAIHT